MKMRKNQISRMAVRRSLSVVLTGGTCLAVGWVVATGYAAPAPTTVKPVAVTSIQGTCKFGGKESTWSAELTAKGNGTYDAAYVSSWGGSSLNYEGTIKTDLKTVISGDARASGGKANGTFEFSGTYGTNGIAQCSYKEVGGRRKGSMTAELPK
jgi:hypothetical protein